MKTDAEKLKECEEFLVAGAAHPLVGESIRKQFAVYGPVVFLKMAANTIRDLEAELKRLKGDAVVEFRDPEEGP